MMRSRVNEVRYREAEELLWASIGVAPKERMLHLRRNDVIVRVQEVGDGPPVLFVHGAMTSGASWARLAARLERFRCIILDRPGTGLSRTLPGALDGEGVQRFAQTLLIDVLDALELESAAIIATSFGGFVALRTAASHPERVRRMVQFSWPVGAPSSRIPMFMRLTSLPGLARIVAALPVNEGTVRRIFRQVGHGPSLDAGRIPREDLNCYLVLLRRTDTLRNELSLGRELVSPFRGLDQLLLPSQVLAGVPTPTRFIWGENDPFGDVETAHRLAKQMLDAEVEVIPNAGHAPWLDDLARCSQSASEFLAARTPG